jgi:hypothetical protein
LAFDAHHRQDQSISLSITEIKHVATCARRVCTICARHRAAFSGF